MKLKFIIILTLLFGSCSKPETKYYYLTDFAKSLAGFQIGSYWIYENDSTSTIDSIYVTHIDRIMQNDPGNGGIESSSETYYCHLKSSLYPNLIIWYYVGAEFKEAYFTFTNWTIWYKSTNEKISSASSTSILLQHPTLSLNGSTYNNITEIIDTIKGAPDYHASTIDVFLDPKNGLIKWNVQYLDSVKETWSLVRSNIIK